MSSSENTYQGVDNLEVMSEAKNYNAWLRDNLVSRCAAGSAVLDFGSGSGTFARLMRDAGFSVTCVEPDALLAGRLSVEGFEVVPRCEDLGDRRFDFIYTLNVLEHIENHQAAMSSLAARLTTGGTLLVYVPAFPILFGPMDRKVGHVRRYRAQHLAELARSCELDIGVIRYADSLGFLAALVHRFIGSSDGVLSRRAVVAYDSLVFPASRVLDRLAGGLVGKNLLMIAHSPDGRRIGSI